MYLPIIFTFSSLNVDKLPLLSDFQLNRIYGNSYILGNASHRILRMYEVKDDDIVSVIEKSSLAVVTQPASLQTQLPVLELLKVCASFSFQLRA